MKIEKDYIYGKIYSYTRFKEINKVIHRLRKKRNYLVFDLDLYIKDYKVTNIDY